MARSKKQVTTTEAKVPEFTITLIKRGLYITLEEKEDLTISVSSSVLDKIDSVYKLIEYRDLLTSVINEYFEHSMNSDSKSPEVNNDDLVPCQCRKIV